MTIPSHHSKNKIGKYDWGTLGKFTLPVSTRLWFDIVVYLILLDIALTLFAFSNK